jgi:hypothetical protein
MRTGRANVRSMSRTRPACGPSDAARRLLRLNGYPERAKSNRRDAVALANFEARQRRIWDGRVPAPLKS